MKSKIQTYGVLSLAAVPGLGSHRLRNLLTYFSSPDAVMHASPRELVRVAGIDRKLATVIAHHKGGAAFADEQLALVEKVNGRIITFWDDEYPELLKKIYDPPVVLFIRGEVLQKDHYSIAIVGTRHPTEYGKIITERISKELSGKGVTIISGLARGIDTIAHTAAIQAGGRTLSIIGSSIDQIYPAENAKLVEQIEAQRCGAILSEFFMGTKTDPGNFPRRNRIISGCSLGTLIVESDHDGGAMITGTTTLDQNRELFCIPGPITSKKSNGTNRLIKQGNAKLVQTIDDIIEELEIPLRPILSPDTKKTVPLNLTVFEQKLFDLLSGTPIHIDEISQQSAFSPSDTLVTLLSLEFKSLVKQLPGKYFVKQ